MLSINISVKKIPNRNFDAAICHKMGAAFTMKIVLFIVGRIRAGAFSFIHFELGVHWDESHVPKYLHSNYSYIDIFQSDLRLCVNVNSTIHEQYSNVPNVKRRFPVSCEVRLSEFRLIIIRTLAKASSKSTFEAAKRWVH